MVDWGNEGIVWRLLAALLILAVISALWVWADFPKDAAVGIFGVIAGFFFGQYAKTPGNPQG